uniref:Ribosome binding factor A n=1 Tax=Cyprinus carpio TaxID=7962 RepID=A0A8C1IW52_CYPCA
MFICSMFTLGWKPLQNESCTVYVYFIILLCICFNKLKIENCIIWLIVFFRHLLISHQILDNVPPAVIIRDKQYSAVTKADFGPDEDNINNLSTNDVRAKLQLMESEDKKRAVLFGVNHDALHKQIEAYKRERTRDSLTQSPAAGGLTQEPLDILADIRKQKLIEKKKNKSKWMKDDDITPKDFLLSRSLQKEDKVEQDGDEDSLLDSQLTEKTRRKHLNSI